MMTPRRSRLRLPTKLEIGGVVITVAALWFAGQHELHPEGDPWWLWAGVAGLVLFGVAMFVGQPAIDTAKAFIGLAGYAKRELKRRSSTAVPRASDDQKPVNDP